MPWPTAPVTTTGMDADSDTLPRSDILDLATKFNQLIAMRGAANGVCDLDGSGLVPNARLAAKIAALAGLSSAVGLLEQTGADAFDKRPIGTASGNIPVIGTTSATEALAGLSRRATNAEAIAGADDVAYMSALKTAQAIAALSPPGVGSGQTWQNKLSVRAATTVYQNTTGKPIEVSVAVFHVSGGNSYAYCSASNPPTGNQIATYGSSSSFIGTFSFIVPPLHYYQVNPLTSINTWWELTT